MSEMMEERSDLMITFGLFLSPSWFFNSTHARPRKQTGQQQIKWADKLYINYQLKRQIDKYPLKKNQMDKQTDKLHSTTTKKTDG